VDIEISRAARPERWRAHRGEATRKTTAHSAKDFHRPLPWQKRIELLQERAGRYEDEISACVLDVGAVRSDVADLDEDGGPSSVGEGDEIPQGVPGFRAGVFAIRGLGKGGEEGLIVSTVRGSDTRCSSRWPSAVLPRTTTSLRRYRHTNADTAPGGTSSVAALASSVTTLPLFPVGQDRRGRLLPWGLRPPDSVAGPLDPHATSSRLPANAATQRIARICRGPPVLVISPPHPSEGLRRQAPLVTTGLSSI
jgi:hypothetical protein